MTKDEVKQRSEIRVGIGLDEEKMPVQLDYAGQGESPRDCKAALLSFFARDTKETMKIDLWTKDMQIVEMDRFFYQTLRSMTETYFKATQNKDLANDFQQFVFYFGRKTGAIPEEG
ncbi:MAG: gliding motility protein GldC [Bacteroidota bacterium]